MSRRYQTVLTSIFDDGKIRSLDEDSRNVFIYLLICRHANLPGLFLLPLNYITRDLQYPFERVSKAFRNLTERLFIEYDCGSETVWVKHWLRHKPLDNPNKIKGALTALDEIPDSPLFKNLLSFIEEEKPNGYETLSEALRKRIETLSKEVTVTETVTVKELHTVRKLSKKSAAVENPVESLSNQIYEKLITKVKAHRPNHKNGKKEDDLRTIRLMLTADKRDPDKTLKLLDWYPIGDKYIPEIYSASALREKYDKLDIAYDKAQPQKNSKEKIPEPTLEDCKKNIIWLKSGKYGCEKVFDCPNRINHCLEQEAVELIKIEKGV